MEYKLEEIIEDSGIDSFLKKDKVLSKDKIDLYYNIQEFIDISIEKDLERGLDYLGKYIRSRYEIKDKYKIKIKRNEKSYNLKNVVKSFNTILSSNDFSDGIEMIYSLTKEFIISNDDLLNEVSGNKEAKDLLDKIEVIYSNYDFKNKKNKFSDKIDFPKSIFLYGPPGTGKSSLIKNTIYKLKKKCNGFVDVNYFDSSFKSKWYGETTKNLESILSKPKDDSKLYINVLDDIDLIFPKRDYDSVFVEKEVLNEFMKYFDDVEKYENVLNFITSNSPDSIDQALIQRMAEAVVYVPGPKTEKEYEKALKYHFRKAIKSNLFKLDDQDWRVFSKEILEKDYTGREIKDLSKKVYLEMINSKKEDVEEVNLKKIKEIINL